MGSFVWHAVMIAAMVLGALVALSLIAWPIILIYRMMRWSMGKPNKPLNIGRPPSLNPRYVPSHYRTQDVHHHHHHHSSDHGEVGNAGAVIGAAVVGSAIGEAISGDDETSKID